MRRHQNKNEKTFAVENEDEDDLEDHVEQEADIRQLLEGENSDDFSTSRYAEMIQHLFFPALRSLLLPPKHLVDEGIVVQIAALEQLYRVFERC